MPLGGDARAPVRTSTASLWGLGLVLAASVIIGVASWASLATIHLDVAPFPTAKWWFLVLLAAATLPVVALVMCVIGLVKKAHRAAAVIGLALVLAGPAAAVIIGTGVGTSALVHNAQRAVTDSEGTLRQGAQELGDTLEDQGIILPAWIMRILQAERE
jgi:hypothetical protein